MGVELYVNFKSNLSFDMDDLLPGALLTHIFSDQNVNEVSFDDGALHTYHGFRFQYNADGVIDAGSLISYRKDWDNGDYAIITKMSVNLRQLHDIRYDEGAILAKIFSGNDKLVGSSGDDKLFGYNGIDHIVSGPGDDIVYGGGGDDVLEGGLGGDSLYGDGGKDTFVYKSVHDSPLNGYQDVIWDFHHGDKIDLEAIDADRHQSGNQMFHLLKGDTLKGHAGEIVITHVGGSTQVLGDVNGDGQPDLDIWLSDWTTLRSKDFIL